MILYPIDIMNSSSPPPSFTISKIEFGLRFFPAAAASPIKWSTTDWSIFVIDFKDKVKIAAIAEELYTTQLIDKAELLQ